MTTTQSIASLCTLAFLAFLAAGCGQKGPLYIERPQPAYPPAPTAKKPHRQIPAQPEPATNEPSQKVQP